VSSNQKPLNRGEKMQSGRAESSFWVRNQKADEEEGKARKGTAQKGMGESAA